MSIVTNLVQSLGRLQQPSKSSAPEANQIFQHDTQPFAESLARIAESQIGQHEEGGNNRGKQVVEYQKATWLNPGAWPWCAAFVCWCVWVAIKGLARTPPWPRPRTAGAYDLEQWASGKYGSTAGFWRVLASRPDDPATWPRRGDIVTFTWSHVGIVTGYDPTTKRVQTVEGNAGLHQTSDSAAGDGVVAKEQHITKVRRLIRYVG